MQTAYNYADVIGKQTASKYNLKELAAWESWGVTQLGRHHWNLGSCGELGRHH